MIGYDNDAGDFAPSRRSRACPDCGGWGSHHALCPSAPADDEDITLADAAADGAPGDPATSFSGDNEAPVAVLHQTKTASANHFPA